jgi:ketosteroid isomerase-like protein
MKRDSLQTSPPRRRRRTRRRLARGPGLARPRRGHRHRRDQALLADRIGSTAFEITVDELVEDGDRVLVLLRGTAHGRASGAAAALEMAIVTTFRADKVAAVDFYLDRAAAGRAFEEPA